jgi:hypothetical protein
MRVHPTVAAVLAAVLATAVPVDPAEAGARNRGTNGLDRGFVVAQSRHGNGSVKGPVRMTTVGPQVRLPGGTWEYCRASCSETLRVQTVDFWEADGRLIGGGSALLECGVFGCLDIGW